jgi:hypothetical protein
MALSRGDSLTCKNQRCGASLVVGRWHHAKMVRVSRVSVDAPWSAREAVVSLASSPPCPRPASRVRIGVAHRPGRMPHATGRLRQPFGAAGGAEHAWLIIMGTAQRVLQYCSSYGLACQTTELGRCKSGVILHSARSRIEGRVPEQNAGGTRPSASVPPTRPLSLVRSGGKRRSPSSRPV